MKPNIQTIRKMIYQKSNLPLKKSQYIYLDWLDDKIASMLSYFLFDIKRQGVVKPPEFSFK